MPFMQIGPLAVQVSTDGAEREEGEYIGEDVTLFDGSAGSTVRGRKDRWRCKTPPLTVADANALEAAIPFGLVAVQGDIFAPKPAATPFNALVRVVGRVPYQDEAQPSGARWHVALRILEA